MAAEDDQQAVSSHVEISKPLKNKKPKEPGVIYLSRIPTFMSVKKIRHIFSQYGDLDRIFLQPNDKAYNGRKGRCFTEGWVEFRNKKIAKQVTMSLNNSQIGGRKRSRWHDEIWNIKYLHRFKWAHLNERLAYEKAVHEQRVRTEISQVKKEANFHMRSMEKSKRLQKGAKKDSQKETVESETSERVFEIPLRETEEEILKNRKRKQMEETGKDERKKRKSDSTESSSGFKKSFLTSLLTGGRNSPSDGDED